MKQATTSEQEEAIGLFTRFRTLVTYKKWRGSVELTARFYCYNVKAKFSIRISFRRGRSLSSIHFNDFSSSNFSVLNAYSPLSSLMAHFPWKV